MKLGSLAGQGSSSEKSATWTVSTNNDTGYKLEISTSGSPAMSKGTDSFANYTGPAAWSIAATDSAFGFSVGDNVHYQGFGAPNSAIQIASNGNETAAQDTEVFFKAEIGANHLQASGPYSANVTLTATTLP